MTHAAFAAAVARIAAEELDGEDVDDAIARLAMSAGMETSMVRASVTEAQQDL